MLAFPFRCIAVVLAAFCCASLVPTAAPQVDPATYSAMRWRLIGPFRAGRVSAVAGIVRKPSALLHWHTGRRTLGDYRRRHCLEANLRPNSHRLHWRDCRRSFESPGNLFRDGRRQRSRPIRQRRRRSLQIHRWRDKLAAHRAGRFLALFRVLGFGWPENGDEVWGAVGIRIAEELLSPAFSWRYALYRSN